VTPVTQDLASSLRALDAEPLAGRSGVELASRRAEAFDLAITAGLAPLEGMALVAIGGYGRSEMAPGSDIDLLLVHEPGLEAGAEEVFAGVLYPLWNAGIRVGHSVRTVEQCRAESMAHLDALTALLDARLLAGEPALAEQARTAAAGIVHEDPAEFVDGLRMWRIERRARAGALAESQEPDLKEALGGLRDLHLLGWLAALEAHELLRPSERRWAGAALDYFLLVRTALHRRAAGSSNSVVADQQPAIADALGVVGEESWESRDVLMRTLFEHGRRANAVATAVLERAARAVGSTSRHELHAEATEAVLLSAFELFARVAHEGGMPAVEELDRVEALVPSEPPATWPPGSVEAFVTMLASGEGGVEALEWLDALGFLPAVLPEWRGVRGRPQRDPYHRYPADVHLLRTAAEMALLLYRPDEPFAAEAAAQIEDVRAPLFGGVLHDIGKVGRGSHLVEGERIAAGAVRRIGLDEAVADDVLFLVREHLLLSDTATRRNLQDEDLILRVAARIGNPRRLAMLYLLTMADAAATGPSASTPWRVALVRELTGKVGRAFDRGLMDPGQAGRLAQAEAAIRGALGSEPPARVERFLAMMPPGYLLWAHPHEALGHLGLIDPPPAPDEVRHVVQQGRAPGTRLLVVGARDRLGLLAALAGAMTLSRLSILTAQAFTTEEGLAVDAFDVRLAAGDLAGPIDDARWVRFEREAREALDDLPAVAERIRRLRSHYRSPVADVPVHVHTDDEASDFFSVVEVGAPDRIGLLFDLTRTFASHGVDVHSAKVATYGPRVVDVFYVTVAGEKLRGEASALEEALARAGAEP
jgi:[protein-PII] uridylyltransferase